VSLGSDEKACAHNSSNSFLTFTFVNMSSNFGIAYASLTSLAGTQLGIFSRRRSEETRDSEIRRWVVGIVGNVCIANGLSREKNYYRRNRQLLVAPRDLTGHKTHVSLQTRTHISDVALHAPVRPLGRSPHHNGKLCDG
ncbi:hypothetical protein JG687_00005921, partial [Phytophthora cactorum]